MKQLALIKTPGIHIILWLTYGLLTFNWISTAWMDYEQSLWLTFRTVSLHALVFYVNVYFLLPKLMEKNRYILYLISVIFLLLLVYELRSLLNDIMPLSFEDFRTKFRMDRPERSRGFRGDRPPWVNPRIIMDIISSVAILFIGTTYWVTMQARKRQQAETSLKNENLNNELKLLKNQINPHFLFNALNNIYSLSVSAERKASDMIMKLSEMLRYVLYESNEPKVSLHKEIEYIRNYIEFQRLKEEGETNVTLQVEVESDALQVEPMLFIPFIENSFKHSNIDHPKGWINIILTATDRSIYFEVVNSKPDTTYSKDSSKGIGIENVKKRLKLLYLESHQLEIKDLPEVYTVKLSLEI